MKSTSTITILAAIATAIVDQSSVFVGDGTNKTLARTGGVPRPGSPAPITPFPTEGGGGVPTVSSIFVFIAILQTTGRRPANIFVCVHIMCISFIPTVKETFN